MLSTTNIGPLPTRPASNSGGGGGGEQQQQQQQQQQLRNTSMALPPTTTTTHHTHSSAAVARSRLRLPILLARQAASVVGCVVETPPNLAAVPIRPSAKQINFRIETPVIEPSETGFSALKANDMTDKDNKLAFEVRSPGSFVYVL